jgi:hypothetical protein
MTRLLNGPSPTYLKVIITADKSESRKTKTRKRTSNDHPTFLLDTYYEALEHFGSTALVSVLITPTIASSEKLGKDTGKLTETLITVSSATDEVLEDSESGGSLAFIYYLVS